MKQRNRMKTIRQRMIAGALSFLFAFSLSLVPASAAETEEQLLVPEPPLETVYEVGFAKYGGRMETYGEQTDIDRFLDELYSLTYTSTAPWKRGEYPSDADPVCIGAFSMWDSEVGRWSNEEEHVVFYRIAENGDAVVFRNTAYYLSEASRAVVAPWVERINGLDELPEKEPSFTDVTRDDWFFRPAEYVFEEGYMVGTGEDRFEPNKILTRGMVATIFYNMENGSEEEAGLLTKESVFSDVSQSDWYGPAVAWGYERGLFEGYGNGNFGPQDSITREQFAVMFAKYTQIDLTGILEDEKFLHRYTDYEEISDWALEAMILANQTGYMSGVSPTKIDPKGLATRAQCASILYTWDHRM